MLQIPELLAPAYSFMLFSDYHFGMTDHFVV